jgi:outer membrane protein assembly factor BamE (lipoprotein component of BamABCDE complex)
MRFLIIAVLLLLGGCIVQAPRYSTIEKVLTLELGMTREQVKERLGIPPYDLRALSEAGEPVLIYIYRTTDRRTLPFLMNETNGMNTKGKFVALHVYFNNQGQVVRLESCSQCDEVKSQRARIDLNAILTFATVTIPAVMIYLGLNSGSE